jgi:hypothetical protein
MGKTPTVTYKILQSICGDEALSRSGVCEWFKPVFLNRRAAGRYRALASIYRLLVLWKKNLPGRSLTEVENNWLGGWEQLVETI